MCFRAGIDAISSPDSIRSEDLLCEGSSQFTPGAVQPAEANSIESCKVFELLERKGSVKTTLWQA